MVVFIYYYIEVIEPGSEKPIEVWQAGECFWIRSILDNISLICCMDEMLIKRLTVRERKQQIVKISVFVLCMVAVVYAGKEAVWEANSGKVKEAEEKRRVVIDAGHGGFDPGKVGINGALEKDINLSIAKKVKQFLEAEDVEVVMTRETEAGLYEESDSNKKVQDMKKRIAIIEEAAPDVTVSIHQNSYHEEYVHGAQVFYYATSEGGKELAQILQKRLIEGVDKDNTRVEKANDSYYLLKKTSTPIVIVECGFLSNGEEADALTNEWYQEKVAWAIHLGILQYLNQ